MPIAWTKDATSCGVQYTLRGVVLKAVPDEFVDDHGMDAYAKALLSKELEVRFNPYPSIKLENGFRAWAGMTLAETDQTCVDGLQVTLQALTEKENFDWLSLSDYFLAQATAIWMMPPRKKKAARKADVPIVQPVPSRRVPPQGMGGWGHTGIAKVFFSLLIIWPFGKKKTHTT